MKERDLCVGNLIYNSAGNITKVTAELLNDFILKTIGAKPIPLTKEWVAEKFAIALRDDNPKQKPHYEGDVLFYINGYEFTNSMTDGFRCYDINNGDTIFMYVHQFQNWHYFTFEKEIQVY